MPLAQVPEGPAGDERALHSDLAVAQFGALGGRTIGMKELHGFMMDEGHGILRAIGSASFEGAVVLVRAAIASARRNKVRDLLVDTTALTGFRSPGIFQRFLAAMRAHGGLGVRPQGKLRPFIGRTKTNQACRKTSGLCPLFWHSDID